MDEVLFISMLFVHWIADFILQTEKQAKGKSTDLYLLSDHVLTYTLCWAVFIGLYGTLNMCSPKLILFIPITFVLHWCTDYLTSRANKKLWDSQDHKLFFISIGFDQILHYLQIYYTFKLLLNK